VFRISHYKISTFLHCPLQYRMRYVDFLGARYRKNWPFLVLGHAVHRALADFFAGEDLAARTPERLKELLRENWRKEERGVFGSKNEERRWGLLALSMLDNYSGMGDLKAKPAYIEETVEVAVSDFLLSGRIDRIDEVAQGYYEVIDYKTGRSVPTQRDLDKDLQMTVYATIAKHHFGFVPSRLTAEYLRSGISIATTRTVDDIAKGIETIRDIVEEIKSCKEFEARPGRLCQWCDFLEICEAGSEAVQAWVSPESMEAAPAQARKDKPRK
jgi:putative RecB family exonuclease